MRNLVAALAIPASGVLLLGGCAPLVCPTIGYGSTIEVTFADPDVVELECVEGCEHGIQELDPDGPLRRFDAPSRPDAITVVGRDAAGAEVLRERVELAWTVEDPGDACGSSATAAPVTVGR